MLTPGSLFAFGFKTQMVAQFYSSDDWGLFDVNGPIFHHPPKALKPEGLSPTASRFPRRNQQPLLHTASEHFIHCQLKRSSGEEVSICQGPLYCSCVQKRTGGKKAGRNPSQSITASGEQLLACVLHPALSRTGGNADRQGQGQEMQKG